MNQAIGPSDGELRQRIRESLSSGKLFRVDGNGLAGRGRDMLSTYRVQAEPGPVSDQALDAILFRAAHPVVNILAPYSAEQRAALLPNVVRLMLAAFLEEPAAKEQ